MLARLRDNWVYGGLLAAVMLLLLTPALSRDWSLTVLLIWLQLPAYMLHQYEEHDRDRFRRFVNDSLGAGREVLSRGDTFFINIVEVWGIDSLAFALALRLSEGLGLMAVYLSLVNGIGHGVQTLVLRRYNPGLATAVLLFLPLSAITLRVMTDNPAVTLADHVFGLAIALLIHAGIVLRVMLRKRQLDGQTAARAP